MVDYNLKLGTSGWFFHGYSGLQLGYLNNYTRTGLSYGVNRNGDSFTIDKEVILSELFQKNGKGYINLLDPNSPNADANGYVQPIIFDEAKDATFRIWSLTVISGLEIEKKINSNYSIGFGVRYEYNLSKTESGKGGTYPANNSSNQRRIGMTFSLLKTIH